MTRFELLMLSCIVLALAHLLWLAWTLNRDFECEMERNRLLRELLDQTGQEP